MKYRGFQVYDDDDFFEKYNQKRQRGNAPNELLEQPIIDELIGSVKGKTILDLGCGDGQYGKILYKRGASFYHGIEGSKQMASLAQTHLKDIPAKVQMDSLEKMMLEVDTFDLVISRLVLHYIQDLQPVLQKVHAALRANGEFVFSIEHPVITSCYDAYHATTKRGHWIVDNYFDQGERINKWIDKDVVKYHRTLEEYWQLLRMAGFEVMEIRESKPERSRFERPEEYERRKRIPLFLFFKVKRMIS